MKQQEIILDSGHALKYYLQVEDTEVIFSQTYYLNTDANDNVFIKTEATNNNLMLLLRIVSGVPVIGATGFCIVKKRYFKRIQKSFNIRIGIDENQFLFL